MNKAELIIMKAILDLIEDVWTDNAIRARTMLEELIKTGEIDGQEQIREKIQ